MELYSIQRQQALCIKVRGTWAVLPMPGVADTCRHAFCVMRSSVLCNASATAGGKQRQLAASTSQAVRIQTYPKAANVTSASSLLGQSGKVIYCTSPIKLASLNKSACGMFAGKPPIQMQRVTAVMPLPGCGKDTGCQSAQKDEFLSSE